MKYILAFEGGGTKTTAGLYDRAGALIREAEGGPSNPVAYGVEACLRVLTGLGQSLLPQEADQAVAAAAVSGALASMRADLARQLCLRLGVQRAVVTSDLHPVLHANAQGRGGILVIAGTGSGVLGQSADGRFAQAGGRGTPFGDEGSAYQIAATALRAAAYAVDGMGPDTPLVEELFRGAGLEDFAALTGWAASATRQQVAALAQVVTRTADEGDEIARACVEDQARRLAQQVLAVQRRLDLDEAVPVFLVGGLFEKSFLYRAAFEAALDAFTGMRGQFPQIRGHAAAVSIAGCTEDLPWLAVARKEDCGSPCEAALLATEQRQAQGKTLDAMNSLEIFEAMNSADAGIAAAVAAQRTPIVQAMDWAAAAIQTGRRILYIGAGTSGRLGVLDASECPPTFGVTPDRVVGIIAGGEGAIRNSVEGAEDDRATGERDILSLAPGPGDLVVGIAASGRTPYTRAALEASRAAGANTVLLCCNPVVADGAECVVALNTGPEVVAGSTRLKAGTACKLVLNMISTGAFAQSGYVKHGLMVNMRPVNAKLRERAVRIVAEVANIPVEQAQALLEKAAWQIGKALEWAKA
ncbi:MAG: N-acetylmuramic acid 6-phosphate etherase [Candidatus Hydrogenedentes bacterium]|nr:N-acetylmuramic acid 6-phosphate etherase [Candidatus Hydrogenedentota bacterium]